MPLTPGRHAVGPENGRLTVHTMKGGAAAKAGHNLVIEVTSWQGALHVGDETTVTLRADARSMRVREGSGGMTSLGDGDKENIEQTIDDEVLKGTPIEFRSTACEVSPEGDRLTVSGELELAGRRAPVTFELLVEGGRLSGSATVKQTDFGMKPYSALFGTLKVLDEVQVAVDARLDGPRTEGD
ncbi:MAG TPA: YceI family protein [Solirubrobacteraceae bacterium]|nr:YceI family protein [Solirubrobacteraceae bacterium]